MKKWVNDLSVGSKIVIGFSIINVMLFIIAVVGVISIIQYNQNIKVLYNTNMMSISHIGNIKEALQKMRYDAMVFVFVPPYREKMDPEIKNDIRVVDEEMAAYAALDITTEEKQSVEKFKGAWTKYMPAVQEAVEFGRINETEKALQSFSAGAIAESRTITMKTLEEIVQVNSGNAEALYIQSQKEERKFIWTIALLAAVALSFAIIITTIVTRSIKYPIQLVARVLQSQANGETNLDIPLKERIAVIERKDEIGTLGKSLKASEDYLAEMAAAAGLIAERDLTGSVKPRSENDVLGTSFKRMIENLSEVMSTVASNASSLDLAAEQMKIAVGQTSQAISQITTTVEEVADGLGQQASDVNKTANSADQMERAIDGVAKGAQEQAEAVADASRIMSQLADAFSGVRQGAADQNQQMDEAAAARQSMELAIDHVVSVSKEVSDEAERSAVSARQGMEMAGKITTGVEKVKDVVEELSHNINELGKRSGQIGMIVETIDDIASQTNLLALNAAIEAARAGEHGKGFAVVADEVRKLAERSSIATKEIAEMVRAIQNGAKEAVDSMERTVEDVDAAVSLTEQARGSFAGIAAGTQASVERVSAIGTALDEMRNTESQLGEVIVKAAEISERNRKTAEAMTKLSNDMMASLDTVSAIVEENTAATEEMAASSAGVTQAIENIASVSEENSAAMEEVTASTEEVSAQTEELNASAQSLAEMAETLRKIVVQFKL